MKPMTTAGIGLGVAALGTTVAFSTWYQRRMSGLREGARILETESGPVEVAEAGEGPVVLLAHGGGTGHDQLNLYGDLVKHGYRVVCPSRPGYLRTPLGAGCSPTRQATLLADTLDAMGIDAPVAIFGISLSGPVAIQFAAQYPKRTWALCLQDAVSLPYTPDKEAMDGWLGRVFLSSYGRNLMSGALALSAKWAPEMTLATFLDAETTYPADSNRARARAILAEPGGRERFQALVDMVTPMGPRCAGTDAELTMTKSLAPLPFTDVKASTLITHSTKDKDVPMAHAEASQAGIAGAELYTFEGGGHLFMLGDAWPALQHKVVDFLDAHRPATRA